MATLQEAQTWGGMHVVDADGTKLGTLQTLFVDRHTGEPAWATVKTGMFGPTGRAGLNTAFVPISGAEREDAHHVRLGVTCASVKHAPRLHAGGEPSRDDERRLYEYYKRSDYDAWTDEQQGRLERVF